MVTAPVLPRWRGLEPLADRVIRARRSLEGRLGVGTALPGVSEVEDRLARLPRYDFVRGYGQMKPALAALDLEMCQQVGEQGALQFALGVLLELAETHEMRWTAAPLDAELKPEFVDSFHRMLDSVERGGSSAMRMNQDAFAKDFAIGLHRLIPAGGQLIDPGAGVPRRILLREPFGSLPAKLRYLLAECGGFRPFAEFHTHQRMRHWFTAEGWDYCFRKLPAVFRSHATLKGVFGGSWFFDPALETVSPSLSFVRSVSQQWGGMIVRDAIHPDAVADALEMSAARRDAYASGAYQPVSYWMVAAKGRILDRAKQCAALP